MHSSLKFVAAGVVGLCAAHAHGQAVPAAINNDARTEVFATYSYDTVGSGYRLARGLSAGGSYAITEHLGVEAKGEWLSIGPKPGLYSLAAGPRLSFDRSRLAPFVYALGGVTRYNVDHAGLDLGGGLDYRLNRSISLRLPEVDYMYIGDYHYGNNPSPVRPLGFSGGIVLRPFDLFR